MAITKIHAVKVRLGDAINYIENPDKTDGQELISGYNTAPQTAVLDFSVSVDIFRCADCVTVSGIQRRKTLCRTSGRPLTARSSSSAVLGGCCSTWIGIPESRTFSVVPDGSERWQHHTAGRRKTPCP